MLSAKSCSTKYKLQLVSALRHNVLSWVSFSLYAKTKNQQSTSTLTALLSQSSSRSQQQNHFVSTGLDQVNGPCVRDTSCWLSVYLHDFISNLWATQGRIFLNRDTKSFADIQCHSNIQEQLPDTHTQAYVDFTFHTRTHIETLVIPWRFSLLLAMTK